MRDERRDFRPAEEVAGRERFSFGLSDVGCSSSFIEGHISSKWRGCPVEAKTADQQPLKALLW